MSHRTSPKPKDWIDHNFWLVLILITLVAGILRFYHLPEKELCFWDEGIFVMGSEFLMWRLDGLIENPADIFRTIPSEHLPDYSGYPVFLQKPFHVVLLAAVTWIQRTVLASLIPPYLTGVALSFVSSLCTILLVGVMGRRFSDSKAGVLAALWLSFQPYHIHYSRLGLHEIDSMALSLVTVLFWYKAMHSQRRAWLVCTGLSLVLTLGTSYRHFLLIPIIYTAVVVETWMRERNLKLVIRRLVWITAGAVLALMFLEMLYRITFVPDYLWSQPGSYLSLLKKKFVSSESGMDAANPLFYLGILSRFDGLLPTLSAITGILVIIFRRKRPVIYIGVLFLVPFIMYSFTTTRLARTLTPVTPFSALAVGIVIANILDTARSRKNRILAYSVYCFISVNLLIMLSHLGPTYAVNSSYLQVFDYLARQDQKIHLSTMKPISAAYLGRQAVDDPGTTLDDLFQQVNTTGVRYLVVDWEKYLWDRPGVRAIESKILPVKAFENPVTRHFATLHENYLPGDVTQLRMSDPTLKYIKIYDLYSALPELGYPLPPDSVLMSRQAR